MLDLSADRPRILDAYFGGPAHRAGIVPGDVILEVDGLDTSGMEVRRFLEYSRGALGTELVYVVAQPGSDERRTARLVRSVVPRETVTGTERADDERWTFGLPRSSIAYVRLTGITASTAHELRQAAERIRRDRLHGVVLDLRGCRSTHMHATALAADLFCTEGAMGASATRRGRTEYRAGPDALFSPASTVVLVESPPSPSTCARSDPRVSVGSRLADDRRRLRPARPVLRHRDRLRRPSPRRACGGGRGVDLHAAGEARARRARRARP